MSVYTTMSLSIPKVHKSVAYIIISCRWWSFFGIPVFWYSNVGRCVRVAYPYVRSFYRSESVVAGQSLELNCRAWGWQTPNVSWYQGQQELTPEDDPRVTLSTSGDRPRGSRLTIDHVDESDRAEYMCVAWALTEELGGVLRQYNATVYVRVKGR